MKKKQEEDKKKKEEMDRKKKEDLDKKKLADVKAKPGPKIVPGKKGNNDDNDDPIEKSLNERIALGGVT